MIRQIEINLNKPVITTKEVMIDMVPIISIFKDEDGDFQFFGLSKVGESDIKLVSLEQVLALYPNIKDTVFRMHSCSNALLNKNEKWIISDYPSKELC